MLTGKALIVVMIIKGIHLKKSFVINKTMQTFYAKSDVLLLQNEGLVNYSPGSGLLPGFSSLSRT